MVAADLVRAGALVPVAIAGLTGSLPSGRSSCVAFVLTTCASYFDPAYGAVLPALAGRDGVQAANALVRSSADALWLAGSAVAAGLLSVVPLSAFFAVNAGSFLLSALLLSGLPSFDGPVHADGTRPRLREAFTVLRPHPWLAASIATLGVAVTISAGTWIVGVPELVRRGLHGGAGRFSLLIVAYALGSIVTGAVLARRPVRGRHARACSPGSPICPPTCCWRSPTRSGRRWPEHLSPVPGRARPSCSRFRQRRPRFPTRISDA